MRLLYLNITNAILFLIVSIGITSCNSNGIDDKADNVISLKTDSTIKGWSPGYFRYLQRPGFSYVPGGGPGKKGSFNISMEKAGLQGYWVKTFKVKGDHSYYFSALRKTDRVKDPARSAVVTIRWLNKAGKPAMMDSSIALLATDTWPHSIVPSSARRSVEAFPSEQPGERPDTGWINVSGYYKTPPGAMSAEVRLYLMWAKGGSVAWSGIRLSDTTERPPKPVRVATVQYGPAVNVKAKTQAGACMLFEPVIREAAEKRADIICLPEIITSKFSDLDYVQAAEPVPGSSTASLGKLAKKYRLYIVAGLIESDSGQIFNTAVLIRSDGTLAGKYRKVSLPREEGLKYGTSPGHKYPVFNTPFGRIGIMTCYDLYFPGVARKLAENGAQIIMMPNGGGNPRLASARAIENQVYLVSSSWTERENWIRSEIFDYEGNVIAAGKNRGDVVVAEIDLNQTKFWAHLGDLKSILRHTRPD